LLLGILHVGLVGAENVQDGGDGLVLLGVVREAVPRPQGVDRPAAGDLFLVGLLDGPLGLEDAEVGGGVRARFADRLGQRHVPRFLLVALGDHVVLVLLGRVGGLAQVGLFGVAEVGENAEREGGDDEEDKGDDQPLFGLAAVPGHVGSSEKGLTA